MDEIGDECFSILFDESRDVSIKEQMAVALRYVNAKGHVIECFLGLEMLLVQLLVHSKKQSSHCFPDIN